MILLLSSRFSNWQKNLFLLPFPGTPERPVTEKGGLI